MKNSIATQVLLGALFATALAAVGFLLATAVLI